MSLRRFASVGGDLGAGAGPLGVAVLSIVVTVVASDAWWVLAITAAGGVALGALLVADSRQTHESGSRTQPPTLRF
jgi:hypothetical protein